MSNGYWRVQGLFQDGLYYSITLPSALAERGCPISLSTISTYLIALTT